MANTKSEGLKRELSIFDVAVNVINISIASGIFLLPAIIASILGNGSIVAYILCGLMFLLIALCFAELGSRITTSGGAYAYVEKAFGPYFGFIASVLLWFGEGVLSSAALINGMTDMLSVPFPVLGIYAYRVIFFFICFSFYAFINIKGVKQGMVVVKTITLVKALPLVLLVIVGLLKLNTANLKWEGFPDFDKLGAASIILFFAFIGGESALNVSGEMKNPKRTAPLGLLVGVVSIIIFFSLIQVVAQSSLGTELNHQKAPLAAAAGMLLGNWSTVVLISCGVIAIFSSSYSLVLVFSRVLFASANDGLLPSFLSKVNSKYSTPHMAIITYSLISFLVAISGGFKQLLVLATISMLLLFVGVALAAIKFRLKSNTGYPASFTLPGGLIIPSLTLFVIIWFLFQSKSNEVLGMGIFLTVLSIIYLLKIFFTKKET